MHSMTWLDLTAEQIGLNLALDEALLEAVEHDGHPPVLRLWESRDYAVVLGASGRRLEDVKLEACRTDGVPVARRSSGGGTVVIGPGALNITVVLPIALTPGLEAVDLAQRFVLARVAESLRTHLPAVEVLGSGDLTLHNRKFAGSAQRRLRRHFMVHTSLLYAFDLDRIPRYTHDPGRQPEYRERRPHGDFVTNLPLPRSALIAAIRSSWIPAGDLILPATVPLPRAERLAAEKFDDPAWIERF